jgi:hypothetical protein
LNLNFLQDRLNRTFYETVISLVSQKNIEQNKKGHGQPGNGHELANFYGAVNKRAFPDAM